HCRETRGQAVVVRRGINDGGAVNGSNRGGAGSLICGHSGAKQVRDGDRGDNEYDGDDDEELNQGESALRTAHRIRVVILSEHFQNRLTRLQKRREEALLPPSQMLKTLLQRRLGRSRAWVHRFIRSCR